MHVSDIYIACLRYLIEMTMNSLFSIPVIDLCRIMFSFCLRKSVYILNLICPVTLFEPPPSGPGWPAQG